MKRACRVLSKPKRDKGLKFDPEKLIFNFVLEILHSVFKLESSLPLPKSALLPRKPEKYA